ncbi:MAG: DUF4388 domain-containing protein [Acidobacteriota bacterium]
MGHGRDRRNATRVSYVCALECEDEAAGSACETTRISDLSLSGAFVDSTTSFAPGTLLTLTFQAGKTQIRTGAEVRYSIPQNGMGVRFLGLTPEHSVAIECLIGGEPRSTPADELPHRSDARPGQPDKKLFLGSFTVISLFDVIQMIENSRLTGVLTVSLTSVKGDVHFDEGEIIGAATEGETGSEALSKLLNAVEGTFEFRKSAAHLERTIHAASNIALLLDLLRATDEQSALR